MASDAGGAVQGEVVIDMALRALHGGMGASERKAGCAMVKSSSLPVGGGMARAAGRGKAGAGVAGIGGLVEVL